MKEFYHKYYSPDNAILIVAGDIPGDKTLELVKKYFAQIPEHKDRKAISFEQINLKAQTGVYEYTRKVASQYVNAYLQIPRSRDKIIPALMLLDYILLSGNNSYLQQRLVQEKNLVYEIGGGIYPRIMQSLFIFSFFPAKGQNPQDIVNEIQNQLRSLKENKDLPHLMDKAKKHLITGFYKNNQKVSELSEYFGHGFIMGDLNYSFDLYEKINQLDKSELLQAISYLVDQKAGLFILNPETKTPEAKP
jgi:zinc protease